METKGSVGLQPTAEIFFTVSDDKIASLVQ